MDAPSILQRLFEQGVHDFHELKIPGLSDQLLLLERRNPAGDAFISPAQPLSKDCLWYIQSTVPCQVTRFPMPGTDAGGTYRARMWVPVGFLQVSEECARVGDVVVYSSDTAWYGLAGGNHIGRLVSREPDMVVSKFTHGHIYMHPIGLVPHAYGPHIAFYQQARVQSLLAGSGWRWAAGGEHDERLRAQLVLLTGEKAALKQRCAEMQAALAKVQRRGSPRLCRACLL